LNFLAIPKVKNITARIDFILLSFPSQIKVLKSSQPATNYHTQTYSKVGLQS
jgi:hypothetical protein